MRAIGSSDDFIDRSSTPNNALSELFLSNESDTRSTKIYFVNNQTRGLDPGYDAGAFGGSGAGIYTHLVEDNTGVNLAIQALPYQDFNDVVVPVGVNVNAGVQATLGLNSSTTNIPSNINIYLEDNVANTWTLLNSNDYTFTPTVSLNGTGRFYIHFSSSVLSVKNDVLNGLNIYTDQSIKQVIVKGQLNSDTVATIYDIQGRVVLSKELSINSTTNTIDVNNLSAGIYIVKLKNTSETRSQKIILK
ncbi:T9SS type A sorting domain-containing protein [Winogradskyella sp.]|uniref:T9SS type A sorting domain-containing protein n=1 Tax=Winogradskyella sp. TaxID=1883156 RepID=UPI0025F22056|nr:T9SS type A sorting domain-containing protein [Winogradskyella sp.]